MSKIILSKKKNDVKYLEFIMKMMVFTGLTSNEIERRIKKILTNGYGYN